jgi:hypothetical protein
MFENQKLSKPQFTYAIQFPKKNTTSTMGYIQFTIFEYILCNLKVSSSFIHKNYMKSHADRFFGVLHGFIKIT